MPVWNSDMLCDIYINLGENHLCHTCKEFPRITQDYTVFCEHTLSFACPEAARLMLESDFDTGFATDIPQDLQTDYSTTEMNFLLSARKRTFEILSDCKLSLSERLCRLLAFNERVQNMLDDEIFDITAMPTDEYKKQSCGDASFIFDLHKSLDIMSKDWLCELEATADFAKIIRCQAVLTNRLPPILTTMSADITFPQSTVLMSYPQSSEWSVHT